VDRLTAHPGASQADSRRAPFETLLDHSALEVALARLSGANGLIGGVGALCLALFITVAYPHLQGFRTGWLCVLSAGLFAYGVIVPLILRRGRHRLGMFLYGTMSSFLVAGYAFLAGRNLSESVAQGVVICAASIPILFARRPTLLILTLALASTTLVFVYERTSYSADRSVILIVQTVMFTALMFWFAQTLFGLSAIERQAKAESEANRARLAGVDARRRNFMNGMSHELRTPLNAIIGFSDMMLRGLTGSLNGRLSEYIADIRNSGLHLLGLVDEVLDTGRGGSSDVEVLTSVFSLEEAGRSASTVVRTDAEARGITIDMRSDAGACYLVADERKVIQILLNLLSNGIKFTPPGGVIEVELSRSAGWSEARVVDHGPGVDPADAQRIFGAFEQGRAIGAQAGGTGLGLAVARHLAEVHGGELFLEQTPGGGATFVLRLPDKPRAHVLDGDPDGAAVEIASPRADSYPGILDDGSALALLKGDDGLARQRARVVGIIAVLETLGFNVLGLLPGHIRVPGWPWIAIVAIALGLLLLHPKARLTANQFYAMHVMAVGVLAALVASMNAAISASLATVLVMAGLAAFTWFRLRRALLIFAEIGVLYALILAFQHGDTAPAARWAFTMALTIQGAVMARYLLRRLPSIVESENRARQEIEEVNAALDEATRRKSEFLASMSHELRTPLNAIIGFAGVLRAEVFGHLEPLQLDYVTDIEQAGRHLLALINDTLDLARADAGRLELHRRLCVVEELIESVVEPARRHADAAGVRLEVSLDRFDRPVIVDALQMARALECIVQNALAVTPAGGAVRIEAQATPAFVVLEVTDTGHQPDTCDYERIFASFEDAGDRLAEPGSRVAYALAHRIAELHGGSLTVGQITAAGACFSLSIPFPTDDSLVAA
jgi:signal transduction histidine kinase